MSVTVTIQRSEVTVTPQSNGVSVSVAQAVATLSVAAGLALSAGVSSLGNTGGTTGIVSGQLALVGSNNITLSQSVSGANATVSIFGGAGGGGGGSFSAGVSTLGNTSGNTGTVSNQLVLAGGNNVTLSQSTNAGGATVTISGASQSTHAHSDLSAGISTNGNTSGNTGLVTGQLVLIGGNNVTLSGSTNGGSMSITFSGPNVGGAQTGISGIANSETTYTSGSVTLSGLANITIRSTTGQHFQFSVSNQTAESQTIGMSNIGNTAGNTSIRAGPQLQIVLAGGNNITLSQSTNGSSATITVSAFNQTSPVVGNALQSVSSATDSGTQTSQFAAADHKHAGVGPLGVSNIGNTAGDTGTQYGRVVLAGGNNITLSVSSSNNGAQTITISSPNTAAQTAESNTIGMSNIGNTSGDTAIRSGNQLRIVLAGGNNITLSQSTNGSSATVTISAFNQTSPVVGNAIQSVSSATDSGAATSKFAAEDHKHAGVGPFGVSNIGNTSGDTGTQYGRVVLAGGNNITLSVSSSNNGAQTVTISGAAGGGAGYTAGLSNIGNTSGDTGVVTGRLVLAGGNNITLSGSTNAGSMTVTISAFTQSAESNTIGMSDIGNTAGDTAIRSGNQLQVVLAGGNGVTLSQSTNGSSATVTISGGGATLDYWELFPAFSWATSQIGQSSLFVWPMRIREALQFDRALGYVSISQSSSSNSSYSAAIEMHVGIYTRNVSTLSLLKSGSAKNDWSVTSNNTTANQAGIRMITAAIQTTLTAGDYWVAWLSVTRTTNANWMTASNVVLNANNTVYSGPLGVASNKSYQHVLGYGKLSVQTGSMPNSFGFSDISHAGNILIRDSPLILNFINGTV